MAIFSGKEYDNRYTAGQEAVNRGNWRLAYDCFKDCKGYIERTRPCDKDEIRHLDYLINECCRMIK